MTADVPSPDGFPAFDEASRRAPRTDVEEFRERTGTLEMLREAGLL